MGIVQTNGIAATKSPTSYLSHQRTLLHFPKCPMLTILMQ